MSMPKFMPKLGDTDLKLQDDQEVVVQIAREWHADSTPETQIKQS